MEVIRNLLSFTGENGAFAFNSVLSLVSIALVIGIIVLAAYFFTGEKKKGDAIMDNLMVHLMGIFNYVWMWVASIAAFAFGLAALNALFAEILPSGKRGGSDFDSKTFITALVMLVVVGLFFFANVMINRKVVKTTKMGSDITSKMFLGFGLLFFSVVFFSSLIQSIMNIIDYIDETRNGLDSVVISTMFVSVAFLAVYLSKAMKVISREK
jgi:hypothetical protein